MNVKVYYIHICTVHKKSYRYLKFVVIFHSNAGRHLVLLVGVLAVFGLIDVMDFRVAVTGGSFPLVVGWSGVCRWRWIVMVGVVRVV